MTLTSREISAFCGRWNNELGPARWLPLTMTRPDVSTRLAILHQRVTPVELTTRGPAALGDNG